MKIALILSGLHRSADYCFPSLNKNLLKDNDVDIYFHTYSQTNVSVNDSSIQEVVEDDLKSILDTYKPKKFLVEDYNKIKDTLDEKFQTYNIQCNPERSMSMFYGMKKAFELIDDDGYDFYIRSRFDILLGEKIDFSKVNTDGIFIPNPVKDKHTYTPDEGKTYFSYVHDSYGIIDAFAVGDYKSVKHYFDLYDRIDDYCNGLKLYFHPEYLTLQNLLINEIKINRFDLDFCLYRKYF